MATLDFSRFDDSDISVEIDSKLDGILTITRSDDVAVDFGSNTIKMDIMKRYGETPVVTLTSATEITVATNVLTFNKTFSELERRSYDYEIYDDTDKRSIMKGKFIVL